MVNSIGFRVGSGFEVQEAGGSGQAQAAPISVQGLGSVSWVVWEPWNQHWDGAGQHLWGRVWSGDWRQEAEKRAGPKARRGRLRPD